MIITAWRFDETGGISLPTTIAVEAKGTDWLTYDELVKDPRFKTWSDNWIAKSNTTAEVATSPPTQQQSNKRSQSANLAAEVPQTE